MSLQLSAFRGLQASSATLRLQARRQPFSSGCQRLRVVRAVAEDAPAEVKNPLLYVEPPTLAWEQDTETLGDVFAFSGPAPERVNGRMAMIGFAGVLGAELATQQTVLEQLGNHWGLVLFYSLLIAAGSIAPKAVSGTSLKELQEAATGANLAGTTAGPAGNIVGTALSVFDTNIELWVGRIAMLGISGLTAVELFTGTHFF